MIRIAVVEDDSADFVRLEACLKKSFLQLGKEYSLERFTDGAGFLRTEKGAFDVVFMDIELPDANGMELAHALRKKDTDCILIFITNLSHYAINGYEVNAFDFVIKPVEYFNFFIKIQRAVGRLEKDAGKSLVIHSDSGIFMLESRNIRYVEVVDHNLYFYDRQGNNVKARLPLKKIEGELLACGFFRCNRCYLVNMSFVRAIRDDNTVDLGDGVHLQIARERRKLFMESFTKYLGGGRR